MKNLKIQFIISSWILLLVSCDDSTIKKREITNDVNLKGVIGGISDYRISVASIKLYNFDKTGTVTRIPSFMAIGVTIEVQNMTDKELSFSIRTGSRFRDSNFFGLFVYDSMPFVLKFLDESREDNLMVLEPNESIEMKLQHRLFDYKELFGSQKDYTSDVVRLLESFQMFYSDDPLMTAREVISEDELQYFQTIGVDKNVTVFTLN